MNFRDLIQSASSSMFRSKARTFLTIIAILIGAMTITLTNGIGTGIKSYLNDQLGNLGATNVLTINLTNKSNFGPKSSNSPPARYNPNHKTAIIGGRGPGKKQLLMTNKDLATIKALPNITSAVAVHNLSPDYIMGPNGKFQLTLMQQFGSTTASMLSGKGVNNNDSNNQISIPSTYPTSLGYNDQSIIGKTVVIGVTSALGQQKTLNATVTGVQQQNLIGNATAFANTALASHLYTLQSKGLPAATANEFTTIEATFPANFTAAQITSLQNQLTRKGYTGQTIKDQENTLFTAINVIIIVFDMFGVIALLAASFGIVNTLLMSVQERTKEIGLMKALGMSPRRIFALFSIEAILIGFLGSVIGVVFAAIIGSIINTIGTHTFVKNFPGLSLLTFPISTILIVIVGIMFIAFLAGTLPAIRASKKDPIEALRYE